MNNLFFDNLETSDWVPPVFPSLQDSEWQGRFERGDARTKKNIANSWLWLFNDLLKQSSENRNKQFKQRELVEAVDYNHAWIRIIRPFVSPEFFLTQPFDGSVDSLMNYVGTLLEGEELEEAMADDDYELYWDGSQINHPVMDKFKVILSDLWFGPAPERLAALKPLVDILDRFEETKALKPKLSNLLQNLAWAAVEETKATSLHRAYAARISLHSGYAQNALPRTQSIENEAWHLAAMSVYGKGNLRNTSGVDTLSVIAKGDIVVAALNIPYLTKRLRNEEGFRQYHTKGGILDVIEKPLDEITDYDVLRTWIPSETTAWNTAETLGISYHDACAQVVQSTLNTQTIDVNLPADITAEMFGTNNGIQQ